MSGVVFICSFMIFFVIFWEGVVFLVNCLFGMLFIWVWGWFWLLLFCGFWVFEIIEFWCEFLLDFGILVYCCVFCFIGVVFVLKMIGDDVIFVVWNICGIGLVVMGFFEEGILFIIVFEVIYVCFMGVFDIIDIFNFGELVVFIFGFFVIGCLYKIKFRNVFGFIFLCLSFCFSLMSFFVFDLNCCEGFLVKVGFFVVFNVIFGVL